MKRPFITSAREIADRLITPPEAAKFDQRPGFLDPSAPPAVHLTGAIGERTERGWRIALQLTVDGKPAKLMLDFEGARKLGLEVAGLADVLEYGAGFECPRAVSHEAGEP